MISPQEFINDYVIVFAVVFFFNILPAFAPPTWATLSYFKLRNPSLSTFELAIVGVVASTLGRFVLYLYSYEIGKRVIKGEKAENLRYLKRLIEEHGPLVGSFLYALGPLPSNFLFIVAGVSGANVVPILSGFFLGRLVSYTTLIYISFKIFGKAAMAFEEYRWVLDVLAFLLAVAMVFMDWKKVYLEVERWKKRLARIFGFNP